MTQKPQQASGYEPGFSALVRSACLTVASRLGDLTDALVIVGGLVPSLLLDQGGIPEGERHVGTRDVDVGLTVSLMEGERYGPGAFVLLKALAFGNRHEPKDAYDLHFMLTHHPGGLADIARRIRSLLPDENADRALGRLRADYETLDHIGPRYAARFVQRDEDEGYRADVKGAVDEVLRLVTNAG